MEKRSNINSIPSTKIRNILRGLLARQDEAAASLTMNHLRSALDRDNIGPVSLVLAANPLFRRLELVDDFPSESRFAKPAKRFSDLSLGFELIIQVTRISVNADKIYSALSDLHKLNISLVKKEYAIARGAVAKFIKDYGCSILILNKISYLYSEPDLDQETSDFCKVLLSQFGLVNRSAIALSSVDMMRPTYDLGTLRRNLLEYASRLPAEEYRRDLIDRQFYPIRGARSDLVSQIQSHGLSSLLDVTAFILSHLFNVPILSSMDIPPEYIQLIPDKIKDSWKALSNGSSPFNDSNLGPDNLAEFTFYRRSIAWVEIASLARFRNGIDYLWAERLYPIIPNTEAITFSRKFFEGLQSLGQLAAPRDAYALNLQAFQTETAGVISSTAAFMFLLRRDVKAESVDDDQLLTILDRTSEIALLASSGQLREFSSGLEGRPIAKYLCQALISEASGSTYEDHKLRRILQDILISSFERDLVKFADFLYKKAPQVAEHFFSICTESFLIQLFLIYDSPVEVFEARANLLDWYAEKFEKPQFADRAKALRIDVRLSQIRGEIDDTRIYVDPIRFNQWFADTYFDELSSSLQSQTLDEKLIPNTTSADLLDFTKLRLPHVRLAIILQASFSEFCTNNRWGIDSYLGRRIRHGTLKGVMFTPVQEVFAKAEYADLQKIPHIARHLKKWLDEYEHQIDVWGEDIFRIRSKAKPLGAINTDTLSATKIDLSHTAIDQIVKLYREFESLIAIGATTYEIFWRLAEKDLSAIRKSVESARQDWGVLSRESLLKLVPDDFQQSAIALCRTISEITNQQFRLLSSWFTQPTNLAPSAPVTLLLRAVLQEVREHLPNYDPQIERGGLSEIEILGSVYHHLYDFLYVVIQNAAKHGKSDGRLVQDITLSDLQTDGSGFFRYLTVKIGSQVRASDTDDLREKIQQAKESSAEDAMVTVGGSGLKKIRMLAENVRDIHSTDFYIQSDIFYSTCVLKLWNA
jgi:hypothetical protein